MKIVFFTRRFYPDIGGVEKHVWEITKRLLAKGHTITIVTESLDPTHKTKPVKGLHILRIPKIKENKNKKFFIWQWLFKKRNILQDADIVHCHDVFYWYLPFRFLYPQKPVFTTFHGYEDYPIKKKAIVVRKISEMLSWGNICIGDFIKKWYGTNPTFVSYGAVEGLSRSLSIARNDAKRESAVFIGRLDEQTGIVTYVKAFELIKKRFPKFSLLVIGDGHYRSRIPKDIKVLGFKKQPEKYFNGYHFAFVSRYLSILEAFAAKKLVFALYDNPVKEDYLKMSPFAKLIIIEKTPRGLAKQIETILSNPDIENKMVNDAYNWVKEQSWEKMVKVYETLWTEAKYDI